MHEPPTGDDILAFIGRAKEHGVADDFVVSLLRRNGCSEKRIYRAFSAYYAGVLGTPLPKTGGAGESARDAFYYLLNFITLGFWAVALGQIFYALIEHWFPDAAGAYGYQGNLRDQISWQVAAVIVAFPIFAVVCAAINRELRRRRDLYDSGIRRWLTYLALVICVVVVALDAIWFVQALLLGQVTVRFVLDSLVLLVIGGGILAYYQATINPPPAAA